MFQKWKIVFLKQHSAVNSNVYFFVVSYELVILPYFVTYCVSVFTAYFTGLDDHIEEWHAALRMYRGTFLTIQCIFLLGINTYGWRSSGVNHVLIFEIDPRNHLNHHELLEVCIDLHGYFLSL
jgi:hypothetical protein